MRVFATFLFLSIAVSAHTQIFQKVVYSVDEGLVTHLIKTAAFDTLGYLWIGTDEGLVRYDGRQFKSYPNATNSRYVKKIINTGSCLMVLSDLGITKIIPGIDSVRFESLWQGQRAPTDSTLWYPKNLYIDKKGRRWVTEPGSIVRLQDEDFKRYEFEARDLTSSFFWSFSLFEAEESLYVISFSGNTYRYQPEQDNFTAVDSDFDVPIQNVHALLSTDDLILLGDGNGLHNLWLERGKIRSKYLSHLNIKEVSCIYQYDSDGIVIGNFSDDLLYLDRSDFSILDHQQIFRAHQITGTKDGNMWVSSDEGIILLRKNFFKKFGEEDHYIESIAITGDEGYYSYKDGVYKFEYEDGQYQQQEIISGKNDYFLSISGDDEDVWISNKDQILHLVDDEVVNTIDLSARGLFIFHHLYDSKRRLWVSQDNVAGLLRITPDGEQQEFQREKGLDARVLAIYDHEGQIFCGGGGVGSYLHAYDEQQEQFRNVSLPLNFEPSTDLEINDIAARNDTLWLASTSGLLVHHGDMLTKMNLGEFTDLPVKAVSVENDYLWLSNTYGVMRVDMDNREDIIVFNEISGLSSRSGNAKGLRIDAHGTKWVGSAKGLAYTYGNQDFYTTKKPFLSQVEVNASNMPLDDFHRTILPNDAFVKLKFLSVTLPGKFLDYQIRNLNKDTVWQNIGPKNFIELGNVKYGEYKYQVRARQNGNYLWSEPANIQFVVGKPYYQKWWFIVFVVVMAMLLIYFSFKINSYRLRTKHRKLNELVNERTLQLRTANEELIRINRELDMFVYSASHDLKAPLSSMIGLLNLYKLEQCPEVRDELIKRMRGSIIKLDTFIKDVIDYSKNARLEVAYEKIDFNGIIQEVLESYKYLENFDQVEVNLDIREEEYVSDKNRIRIVFNNMISNAIRYSDMEKEQSYINIKINNDGQMILIVVSDNGIGIKASHKEKVFEMFYRANEEKVGSGLGLYIVKEATINMGGTISLESEPGKGSTFTIRIPNHAGIG